MDIRVVNATLAALLTGIVGVFPYLYKKNQLTKLFAASNVALAIWNLGDVIVLLPEGHISKVFLFRLNYVAGVFVVWYFFRFMLAFAKINMGDYRKTWNILRIVGAALIALSLTPALVADIDETVTPFKELPGPVYPFFVIFLIYGLGFALYRLFAEYRHSSGREKIQLKYMFAALFFTFSEALFFFLTVYYRSLPPYYFYLQVVYSVIVAYSILAHRLMDITVIVRKTLIYSLVTASLTAIYLLVVAIFTHVFEGFAEYQTVFSSGVAAALIATCFEPLRKKVQLFIDGKFFRQYVDREEKLYELSREVVTHTTSEAMGKALVHVLDETLHPKLGALYLRSPNGNGFERVSGKLDADLPLRMGEDDPLATYFQENPQPFIHDMSQEEGRSYSTRSASSREDAA